MGHWALGMGFLGNGERERGKGERLKKSEVGSTVL